MSKDLYEVRFYIPHKNDFYTIMFHDLRLYKFELDEADLYDSEDLEGVFYPSLLPERIRKVLDTEVLASEKKRLFYRVMEKVN